MGGKGFFLPLWYIVVQSYIFGNFNVEGARGGVELTMLHMLALAQIVL